MIADATRLVLLYRFALTLGAAKESAAQDRPAQIQEIYRDYLKPEAIAANRKLEKRTEYVCRTLGFLYLYLTIESVSAPAEVWYFNGFESQAEVEKLRREYENNEKLTAALSQIVQKKAPVPHQNLRRQGERLGLTW